MSQFHQLALKQAEFEDHVHGQHWVWKTSDKCDTLVSDRCGISGVANALWATKCFWRFVSGTVQDATLWDVAPTRLAGVPQMYANGVCT